MDAGVGTSNDTRHATTLCSPLRVHVRVRVRIRASTSRVCTRHGSPGVPARGAALRRRLSSLAAHEKRGTATLSRLHLVAGAASAAATAAAATGAAATAAASAAFATAASATGILPHKNENSQAPCQIRTDERPAACA